jgi:hypothetical protein
VIKKKTMDFVKHQTVQTNLGKYKDSFKLIDASRIHGVDMNWKKEIISIIKMDHV